MILGNPISLRELAEIIERIQSGKTTFEQEVERNLAKGDGDDELSTGQEESGR